LRDRNVEELFDSINATEKEAHAQNN